MWLSKREDVLRQGAWEAGWIYANQHSGRAVG